MRIVARSAAWAASDDPAIAAAVATASRRENLGRGGVSCVMTDSFALLGEGFDRDDVAERNPMRPVEARELDAVQPGVVIGREGDADPVDLHRQMHVA